MSDMGRELLCVKELNLSLSSKLGVVRALRGVSFRVYEGEILAILGESGCGKSLTALSVVRLVSENSIHSMNGEITFKGVDLTKLSNEEIERVRGREIGFVFQDPMNSLHPLITIGEQIAECFVYHFGMSRRVAWAKSVDLLCKVGVADAENRSHDYPHQFSGGMRQRVSIAIALSCDPDLILADEPTTALDVTIQAQILKLFVDLRKERGLAIVIITHDLSVAASIADRVVVMYSGKVVEVASVDDLFSNPKHPYTKSLFSSLPSRAVNGRLVAIDGQPNDIFSIPSGCAFHPRCRFAMNICALEDASLSKVSANRYCACHLYNEGAVAMRRKFEEY